MFVMNVTAFQEASAELQERIKQHQDSIASAQTEASDAIAENVSDWLIHLGFTFNIPLLSDFFQWWACWKNPLMRSNMLQQVCDFHTSCTSSAKQRHCK